MTSAIAFTIIACGFGLWLLLAVVMGFLDRGYPCSEPTKEDHEDTR